MKVHTIETKDHGDAYDLSQTSEAIKTGHFIELSSNEVVCIVDAYPSLIIQRQPSTKLHAFTESPEGDLLRQEKQSEYFFLKLQHAKENEGFSQTLSALKALVFDRKQLKIGGGCFDSAEISQLIDTIENPLEVVSKEGAQTFLANLNKAIWDRETVKIGKGIFQSEELKPMAEFLEQRVDQLDMIIGSGLFVSTGNVLSKNPEHPSL